MKSRNKLAIKAVVGLYFFLECCHLLASAYPCQDYLDLEAGSKQQVILEENRFTTERSLSDAPEGLGYFDTFGSEFTSRLMSLNPAQRWLDSGTGKGKAIDEYLRLGGNAQVVGLVYKDVKGVSDDVARDILNGRLSWFSGRLIEEIPNEELGRFDVISDFFGPLSYTSNLSEVLKLYFKLLKPNGRLYIRTPIGGPVTWVYQGQKKLRLVRWLEKRKGISISTHPFVNKHGDQVFSLIIEVTNLEDALSISDLNCFITKAGNPPDRICIQNI